MNITSLSKRFTIPAFKELFIISIITLALIVSATATGWTKVIVTYFYKHENSLIDDFCIPLIITSILLIIYSLRRNNESIKCINKLHNAEGSLNNASAQLEVLMELNSAMLFKTKADADFTMIYMSANVEEIIGYSYKRYFEKGFWYSKVHPDDAQKVSEEITAIFKTGAGSVCYRFKDGKGNYRWMKTEVKCLYDDKGNPKELIGNSSNIDEIKKKEIDLQNTYNQLEVLMQSSSAVLFRTKIDEGFTLIDTTENVKQVLGYSKEEMFEKNFWANNMHPTDAACVFEALPALFENGFFGCDFRFRHKDSSWRWMRSEMKCLYDKKGKPYEIVGNWWDITENKKAQLALQTVNDRFELLLQSTSTVLVNAKITGDHDVIFISDNVTKVLGYSKVEFSQKHFWFANLHPEDSPGVLAAFNELNKKGSFNIQYRFLHKDGSWRWIQDEWKCIYDGQGNSCEMVAAFRDITRDKQIQEQIHISNERFQLVSKATRDILYDWNLVTDEVWVSDEIFKSFGYTKETYRPNIEWWKEAVHSEDREFVINQVIDGLKQKIDNFSRYYRFKKADGSYANVFSRGYVVYNAEGVPLRWIGSVSDITHLKNIELQLKDALIKSEESAKAKSEFLANMSHEIRTPLNGIVGMTDLALDTDLTSEQKRYLETVKLSCDSLLALINDILDFSKIEAGKLDLSPVNFSLRDEIPALLSPLALRAANKQLEFVFSIQNDVPDSLLGDVYRLHQIITNLVGNAIKFTERGEIVLNVELESASGDEAVLLFSVRDTGIGIPLHKLEVIFDEFIQADGSTTRKYGGTGLGLSITKRLTEMMGGKIWVESVESKGTAFYFTVKMKSQNTIEKARFIPLPVLDNSRVLVIEDNDLSRKCTVRILENFHMIATEVASGERAIDELRKAADSGNPYPLVLTDISLAGEIDGFDVAKRIKEDDGLGNPDIIVISMSQQGKDRERFALLGVKHCFPKPFSQSDLLDGIQNTLSARTKTAHFPRYNNTPKQIPVMSNSDNPYKILLAEDNIVNQEVAATMLKKKGHTVVIANNGAEAAAIYLKEAFDLILMDVQMPLLNGYEATARIRDIESVTGKYTPVIGLTANAMKGDREKCLEAGMDDYVSKPVKLNNLFSALDRIKEKINKDNNMENLPVDNNPLISLDTLLENLDGDHEVLESILEKFDSTVLSFMDSIETNAKKGKAFELISLSHTLKGQCMLVEMETVIKLADQIETLAAENALTDINQLIPILKSELQRGLKALNEARAKISVAEAV